MSAQEKKILIDAICLVVPAVVFSMVFLVSSWKKLIKKEKVLSPATKIQIWIANLTNNQKTAQEYARKWTEPNMLFLSGVIELTGSLLVLYLAMDLLIKAIHIYLQYK